MLMRGLGEPLFKKNIPPQKFNQGAELLISTEPKFSILIFFPKETVHRAVPNKDATWNLILPMIKLPKDKEKNRKCLERAVNMGHCLLLFSSLRITRSSCLSIKVKLKFILGTYRYKFY